MAVSSHAQQKIGLKYLKSWPKFQNFSSYRKSGTEGSNMESNFTLEVVLRPFLRMRTQSGQNGPKRGQIGKNSGSVQNRGQRT